MARYKDIIIGCGHNFTILIDDTLHFWGNTRFPLSNIKDIKEIKSISCGDDFIIASTYTPNRLYVWGNNKDGQLGLGHNSNQVIPQELILCSAIKSVSCCCSDYTIVLLKTGECYSWGCNYAGQLGLGNTTNQNSPKKIMLSDIISVNCGKGGIHNVAQTKSGTLYVWGGNAYGELGLGDKRHKYRSTPTKLILKNVVSVDCGRYHTIALTSANKIYIWGSNNQGQLGLGHYESMHTPQELNLLEDVISINCGGFFTMVLTKGGTRYIWGDNYAGKSSAGRCNNTPQKFIFHGAEPIKTIYSGIFHTFIITLTNRIYGWGGNCNGQLGLGDEKDRCIPTELTL